MTDVTAGEAQDAFAFDDEMRETVQEVLRAVDGVFDTRVSFVSRFVGDRFHVLDAVDTEGMGFDPGLDVALSDTF